MARSLLLPGINYAQLRQRALYLKICMLISQATSLATPLRLFAAAAHINRVPAACSFQFVTSRAPNAAADAVDRGCVGGVLPPQLNVYAKCFN